MYWDCAARHAKPRSGHILLAHSFFQHGICVVWKCEVFRTCAGDAEAIFRRAEATAKGLHEISEAITAEGGNAAASMRIAEQVKTDCSTCYVALTCATLHGDVASFVQLMKSRLLPMTGLHLISVDVDQLRELVGICSTWRLSATSPRRATRCCCRPRRATPPPWSPRHCPSTTMSAQRRPSPAGAHTFLVLYRV